MQNPRLLVLSGLLAAGCQSAPSPFAILPDPLPSLADATALDAAPSTLAVGDRLEFEWTSTLGESPESATCIVELIELGERKATRKLTPSEVGNLRRTAADLGRELGLPIDLVLSGEKLSHDLPGGAHTLAYTMQLPDGSERRRELLLPIACEGRGFPAARLRVQSLLSTRAPQVDIQGLFDICMSVWAPFALFGDEHDLRRLPGVDLAMTELADMPSMFRSFFQWLFLNPLEVQFPFWEPWPTVDGRYFVPVHVVWGSSLIVKGYAEMADPKGLLSATSGITGLKLWRPSDESKSLTLRLVRCSRGGEQLIAIR